MQNPLPYNKHLKDLKKSCLTEETIKKAGYQSDTFYANKQENTGWSIEYHNPFTGKPCFKRYRYDTPPDNGKRKYHQDYGEKVMPYFTKQKLGQAYIEAGSDSSIPVIIGEGEKKIDCVYQFYQELEIDIVPIGISGVWNWSNGNKELHDLIDEFVLLKREFLIIVDSDFKTNNKIQQAMYELAKKLLDKDCSVFLLVVPGNLEGSDNKQGIDDYLLKFAPSERASKLKFLVSTKKEKIKKSSIQSYLSEVKKKIKKEQFKAKEISKPNSQEDLISDEENWKTPGQIVMNKLFQDCNFISVGFQIYQYSSEYGYYKKVQEGDLKKEILDFFDSDDSLYSLSNSKSVAEALDYLRLKTSISLEKINQAGINLRNGFLNINYEDGVPFFDLKPHSPDNYSLTYCDFDYDPNFDSSVFDNFINSILTKDNAKVLLQSIAACLDLPKVRAKIGRLKAVLLLGEGNNGKDTIREYTEMLFSRGFTNIDLAAFKNADYGKTFGIYDLINSRVNWSSENIQAVFDKCEKLKSVISGDPIDVEAKFKQPIRIKPKAIILFNLNKIPLIEARIEAIKSRFVVIDFPFTFKLKPDPNNEWEKLADPRYKEDKEFIKKNILPAYLNRILDEFKSIFVDGIDYTINEGLMDYIREQSNHLQEFKNDTGLCECNLCEGLEVKYIFDKYLKWCEGKGYIEHNGSCDSHDRTFTYNDPSVHDNIIRNPASLGKRLNAIFPNLKRRRSQKIRKIGLKFLEA